MSVALNTDLNITPYVARCIAVEEIPILDVGSYLDGNI